MNIPAKILLHPGKEYALENRKWQGVPSIEKTGNRLWSAWFTGGKYEPSIENHAVVAYSDDDGKTWIDPYMVIDCNLEAGFRVFDPQLWLDNKGKLWLLWCQDTYAKGIKPSDYDTTGPELERDYFCDLRQWAMCCENPEAEEPVWSEPRYLWKGLTKNNIEVLSDGRWLVAIYDVTENFEFFSQTLISEDEGKTFILKDGPVGQSCEPMTVERKDGSFWFLTRTWNGYLAEAFSYDGGETWTDCQKTEIPNPSTRFFLGRLKDDSLILVNTPIAELGNRKTMVVSLSDDEGKTWKYDFMIDERRGVSYPDFAKDKDGNIYIVYDCQRDNRQEQDEENPLKSNAEKEIVVAKITVQDIKAGKLVTEGSYLKNIISKVNYDNRELG
ncbi:MAG: exo-alpha-sialidase [Clostridia bacterium]|nr:exo-alpha-sialidase [Clostridia bacterium]